MTRDEIEDIADKILNPIAVIKGLNERNEGERAKIINDMCKRITKYIRSLEGENNETK